MDPVIEAHLVAGEVVVASFMEGLSSSMKRYNELLHKALPQNPKAHYYYYTAEEEKEAESQATKDGAAPKDKKDGEGKAAPTSPLLKRKQLKPSELKDIKKEAKDELIRRQSSVFDLTTAGSTDGAAHAAAPGEEDAAAGTKTVKAQKFKNEKKLSPLLATKEQKLEANKAVSGETPLAEEKKKQEQKKSASGDAATPATAESAASPKSEHESDWEDEEEEEEEGEGEITAALLFEKIAPSPQLLQELRVIKKEARELSIIFEKIHDWIAMNIPTMKEEDNSNVEIMAAVIGALEGFSQSTAEVANMESVYLVQRAAAEIEFIKNPEIAANLQQIAVIDSDQWDSIERGYRGLMRTYIIAHSQLAKNMEALRNPREKRYNFSM